MKKVEAISDIQLLASIVVRLLTKEHQVEQCPNLADYTVREYPNRFNGSSDIHVAVKVGRGVSFDVTQHWPQDDDRNMSTIMEAATEIADNVATVHEQAIEIMEMCKEVHAATSREIRKAERRGIDYRLLSAQPIALRDRVRDGFAVRVVYERLSEYLRMEPITFDASYGEEVSEEFAKHLDEQIDRSITRRDLDAIGATGRIDSVLVNALRKADYNIPHILQRLAAEDNWLLEIGERGRDRTTSTRDSSDQKTFTLHWKNGAVYGQVLMGEDTSWHEGKLSFKNTPISLQGVEGRRLAEVVGQDEFGDIRIRSSHGQKGDWGRLDCEGELLYFNADTGRLWKTAA